tara:strand:- start:1863 stop:2699 length:837 start_codon:yes stop_codon:yes gene_type:complete
MKKSMIVALGLMAGTVSAQDGVVMVDQGAVYSEAMTEATLEVALASSYVWRGQVLNNDAVIQPQITLAQYGFSLNMWMNYDIGSNRNGVQRDVSEFDFSIAYSLPMDINQMAIDVGLVNYNFPANGTYNTDGLTEGNKSTTEAYLSATFLSFKDLFIPSVTLFGDFEEVEGTYVLFDVFVPYELSEYVGLAAGVTAGYGNTKYNDVYWTADGTGDFEGEFSDYSLYATASYEVSDRLTAGVTLNYSMLNGDSFKNGAKAAGYEADDKVWGSLNVAYDF